MSDIVFIDTETLGLHPDAPIWEFAAIRRETTGSFTCDTKVQIFIQHDPTGWLDDFPVAFKADYQARFDAEAALPEAKAAEVIASYLDGAHVIGAVPNFDTERLAKLLQRNGIEPGWHYHLIDVENLVVGYLVGVGKQSVNFGELESLDLDKVAPPWKSDALSRAVGVDPEQFDRHTAMGDVLWVKAQYDAVIGGDV